MSRGRWIRAIDVCRVLDLRVVHDRADVLEAMIPQLVVPRAAVILRAVSQLVAPLPLDALAVEGAERREDGEARERQQEAVVETRPARVPHGQQAVRQRAGMVVDEETADAAVAGVNATNDRISALDDYEPQTVTAVNFRTGSSVLSADSKTKLDEIASKAMNSKGYVIEVSGYADSTGSVARNRALSQRRADAVIRYLVENHNIPLRRIVTPYGYGEMNPVAENETREGREKNRRVEIKLLVNKGLTSPAPTMNPGTSGSGN